MGEVKEKLWQRVKRSLTAEPPGSKSGAGSEMGEKKAIHRRGRRERGEVVVHRCVHNYLLYHSHSQAPARTSWDMSITAS